MTNRINLVVLFGGQSGEHEVSRTSASYIIGTLQTVSYTHLDVYKRQIDILVSTTVIEVGIDQPNATLLIVENAERFGLSQLHQLRGRVGRSQIQSYCVLVSDSDDPLVRRRLTALCKNSSGFAIAEEDLLLRGPGDVCLLYTSRCV